jgi:hypothetical protein
MGGAMPDPLGQIMREGAMQELEVDWQKVLRIWWLIVWRSTLGAVLIGFVLGFVLGFIGAMLGIPERTMSVVASVAGALVGLGWSLVVVRMALLKRYDGFRIALVAG